MAGLNEAAFAAIESAIQLNPGSLTERDARELATAIAADQVVDDSERDLLEEMTQSQFRSITVTPAGDTARSVRTYPSAGNAKKLLQGVLNPQLDLDAAVFGVDVGLELAGYLAEQQDRHQEREPADAEHPDAVIIPSS